MDVNELKDMIELFEATELTELEIEEDGLRICLKKNTAGSGVHMVVPSAMHPPQVPEAAPASESAPPVEEETYAEVIPSPMVGTFYSSPAPGEAPFIQEGDQVEDGQTVCIVEAMKLMNEVGSNSNCVIEKVLVENGQPVEFGQPLFAIRHV